MGSTLMAVMISMKMDTLSKEVALPYLFYCLPTLLESTLRGKNLLANSFL